AVGCRYSGQETFIGSHAIKTFPLPFSRESLSIGKAFSDCLAVRRLLKSYQPDLVHLVALRPILLGWLASHRLPRMVFVNAITGLGSLFTGEFDTWRLRVIQFIITRLLRPTFRRESVYNVFQNREDLGTFLNRGYSRRENSFLIRGAGVEPRSWLPKPEPN